MKPEQVDVLRQFLPENSVRKAAGLLDGKNVRLVFVRHRNTKLGDFRPPRTLFGMCTITLNGDMNPYRMLVTFLHEYAHFAVFKKYSRHVQPHGAEWKREFAALVNGFIDDGIFPPTLAAVLRTSMDNPKAGAMSDTALAKALGDYDDKGETSTLTVDDVPSGTVFALGNGRRFVKIEKLRKRYKCRSLDNGKIYIVSPLAEAVIIEEK